MLILLYLKNNGIEIFINNKIEPKELEAVRERHKTTEFALICTKYLFHIHLNPLPDCINRLKYKLFSDNAVCEVAIKALAQWLWILGASQRVSEEGGNVPLGQVRLLVR